jgi:Flp pilus assembly protein TadD
MIGSALIALSVAAATPEQFTPSLAEAEHAIGAGRLEQARLMIGRAVAAGVSGTQIDRLLADLAFATGNNDEAQLRYQKLLATDPTNPMLAERAGMAALKLGNITSSTVLIDRATKSPKASWRAWNARGVIADLEQDWSQADIAYAEAAARSPDESEIINNQGWSQLLRGDWKRAADLFERAARLDPHSTRIANNLELARGALATELPQRRAGEDDREWAARLNDAGLAAQLMGNQQRAVAAFTQALEASGTWYARAANNLQAAGGR